MSDLVFVYGTLKEGRGNYKAFLDGVSGVEKLGEYSTPPKYTMFSLGGFPGVLDKGNTSIEGEVFSVDEDTFRRLDGLEGYPNLYTRKQIDTEWGKAWIYLIQPDYVVDMPTVNSGRW